ncbi:MAG: extracellular matrix regulator RemB [Bacillota bacterium]
MGAGKGRMFALYVHLGGDVVVRARDVVAIVDLAAMQRRGLSVDQIVRGGDHAGGVTVVGDGVGTSLVVTAYGIYVSPISPLTLRRRAATPWATEREEGGIAVLSGRSRRRTARRRRRSL